MKRVGLVTCRKLPEPDPDETPLLAALRDAGVEARLLPWDDPWANPGAFDLCVLRSCWNYPEAPDAFLDWIDRAAQATKLRNPAPVVRWNLHKRYLAALEAKEIPVVPTEWIERGREASLETILRERGWDDVVVKPAVSAASYRTRRFRRGAEGEAFLRSLVAERDAMVQPYLPGFEEERAVVWIDGAITHAVRKRPRFTGDDEGVSEALPVSAEEADLALRTLASLEGILYARADLVGHAGALLVSELELIEPSLFLAQNPAALERLVAGILKAL